MTLGDRPTVRLWSKVDERTDALIDKKLAALDDRIREIVRAEIEAAIDPLIARVVTALRAGPTPPSSD